MDIIHIRTMYIVRVHVIACYIILTLLLMMHTTKKTLRSHQSLPRERVGSGDESTGLIARNDIIVRHCFGGFYVI